MLPKKTKFFIIFFFILLLSTFFQTTFAKYVIEDIYIVAKIDIDRCKPKIELLDITSSNSYYPTYANHTHLIRGHLKITEKNLIRNDLSTATLKVAVGNRYFVLDTDFITPEFKSFSLISENANEKIYEFSFTNTINNGGLTLVIPKGILEDKSGLVNEKQQFSTEIAIDNQPPRASFKEISASDGKSLAEIRLNETIMPIEGWNTSSSGFSLSKEFLNPVSYSLPLIDYAQNLGEVLIDIKNASHLLLEYGTYDDTSKISLATSGQITAPNTISSHSICKSEALFLRLSSNTIPSHSLQGRCYVHTYWGENSRATCELSELPYYHGYNPKTNYTWWTVGTDNWMHYKGNIFTQFGGTGSNYSSTAPNSIPSDIAIQYLFGLSSIQFRLTNTPNYSIVYQCYVNGIGWLKASSDGEENYYQKDKPFSSIRINIVPKTEKSYLIEFWNRDSKI